MTTIMCDFDGAYPREFAERLRVIRVVLGWRVCAVGIARSRRGWHLSVSIARRLDARTTVAAQAILGSDWRRETFNLARARHWRKLSPYWRARANTLYAGKVTTW